MKKFMQRKKKGFTLVELMVVVAIIAVLVLLAVPRLAGNSEKAKTKVFESNFRTLISDVTMSSTETDPVAEVKKIAEKATALNGRPESGVTYAVGTTTNGYGVLAEYSSYQLYFDTSTGQTSVAGKDNRVGASFDNQGTIGSVTPIP